MHRTRFAILATILLAVPALRAADLDPHLPADTESYLSVNVRQILDSPVFKKQLLTPARTALKEAMGGEIQKMLQDLGLDPFRDLDRVIIATPGGVEPDRGLVILHGTFDVAKVDAKAREVARDKPGMMKLQKARRGGVEHTIYETVFPNQDMALYAALPTNKTLILSPGKDYVVDALEQVRAKKKPELKNKEVQALLEKLDTKQSLSVAYLGKALANANNEVIPPFVSDAFRNIEAIGGGVTIENEMKVELLMASKTAEAAAQMQKSLDKLVKMAIVGLSLAGENGKAVELVLEVFKTVKVTSRDKVVTVKALLTQELLGDFFK